MEAATLASATIAATRSARRVDHEGGATPFSRAARAVD